MISDKIAIPIAFGSIAAALAFFLYKSKGSQLPDSGNKDKKQASKSSNETNPSSLWWDNSTIFASRFKIEDRKVTLIHEENYYQIIGLKNLPLISTTKFRLLKYGGESAICFGIITANRKEEFCSGNIGDKESVGYWTSNYDREGLIAVDGERKVNDDTSLYLAEGDNLVMETDLRNLTITFFNSKDSKKHIFSLAEHYKEQLVYFFVTMGWKGDSIEIIE